MGHRVDFGFRNWEPARRVGVRRTIADLKKTERETRGNGETETLCIAEFLADS
jgi:hypothetical protein